MADEDKKPSFWRFGALPGEGRALAWSFAYFFFVMATYYLLRPVRDEMGVRSGVGNLPWLFTGSFIVGIAIAPIYGALVAKLKRRVFVPTVYGFLLLNMLAFWVLLTANIAVALLAKVFFVWLTVYVAFAVSVFWSFMADVFTNAQARRLYPAIASGGAIGGIAGSLLVSGLVKIIGQAHLLPIAAALLALAIFSAVKLERAPGEGPTQAEEAARAKAERPVGGGWWAGIVTVASSPYLLGIGAWVFLGSVGGAFIYYMQASVVSDANLDIDTRTQLFGLIDLATNAAMTLIQLFATRQIIRKFGVGFALGFVSLVAFVGFGLAAFAPVFAVIIGLQIASRTSQYAVSNPAREALWTVVSREEKFKSKNVVDLAVFRGSDLAGGWIFTGLHKALGLSLPIISLIALPLMIVFFILSLALGRTQARRAAAETAQGDTS